LDNKRYTPYIYHICDKISSSPISNFKAKINFFLVHPMLDVIFEFLPLRDLAFVAAVSKSYRNAVHFLSERRIDFIVRSNSWLRQLYCQTKSQPFDILTLVHRLVSRRSYLIGGQEYYRRVDSFFLDSCKWRHFPSLALKREEEFACTVHNNCLLVLSGCADSAVGKVEIFNPFDNHWHPFVSLPRKLIAPAVLSHQGRLLAFGGFDLEISQRTNHVYSFICEIEDCYGHQTAVNMEVDSNETIANQSTISNPIRGYWQLVEPMQLLYSRSHHASISYRSCIYVAGGIVAHNAIYMNGGTFSKMVEYYDSNLKNWIRISDMNRARYNFKLYVIRDELYAVGGDIEGVCSLLQGTIEKYDTTIMQWIMVTTFPHKRHNCASSCFDTSIFIFGGKDGRNVCTTWDRYDVLTNSWASEAYKDEVLSQVSYDTESSQSFDVKVKIGNVVDEEKFRIPGRLKGITSSQAVYYGIPMKY
jgi:hypothetical protein